MASTHLSSETQKAAGLSEAHADNFGDRLGQMSRASAQLPSKALLWVLVTCQFHSSVPSSGLVQLEMASIDSMKGHHTLAAPQSCSRSRHTSRTSHHPSSWNLNPGRPFPPTSLIKTATKCCAFCFLNICSMLFSLLISVLLPLGRDFLNLFLSNQPHTHVSFLCVTTMTGMGHYQKAG